MHLLRMTVPEMLFYRLPFTVGFYLLYTWLTCGTRSAMWTELYEAFLAPSMGITALRSLIKPFGTPFRVTDKTIRKGRLSVNRRVAMPFVILLLLHVAGIAFSLLVRRHVEESDAFTIVLYFTFTNIAMLWICLLVSVDVAQPHPFVRFPRQMHALVSWDDTGLVAETEYLSEGDVVLKVNSNFSPENVPAMSFLHLPDLGIDDVPVRFKDTEENGRFVFEFIDLPLNSRRVLIEYLFCQPKQWDRPPRSELLAAWEFLRAGLRMYPLAESR